MSDSRNRHLGYSCPILYMLPVNLGSSLEINGYLMYKAWEPGTMQNPFCDSGDECLKRISKLTFPIYRREAHSDRERDRIECSCEVLPVPLYLVYCMKYITVDINKWVTKMQTLVPDWGSPVFTPTPKNK